MAATDARPVPRKNAAWRVYFAIRKNDGTLITSWTGADSEVSLDGAAFADCTNEATEIGTSGCGYLDLTSSEMNADAVTIKITVTNTSALPLVLTVFPEEAGDYRVADTQKVDVETIKTQALTAAAGITFGVYVGGTAAAAVASTALSTDQWTNTLATNLGTTNTTVATNLNATVSSRLASASYTAPPSAATISTQVASDLATAHGAGSWATATGFSTHSAADVWAVGTRTITGGSLTTSPPTAAVIADAVWDEARSGHVTAGTFGEKVIAELDSAVPGQIADAVWDEAMSGHTTNGTYGARVVRATNSNVEVQITGSNHVASDVHEFQAGVITAGDFANNSITAAALAADAVTEIQNGLSTLTASQVNAEVVDALSVDTYAELTAPPASTSSLKDKITWLFMYARNKVTQTATQRKLYRDDGTTVAGTSATDDTAGTFTKGEDA